MGGPSLPLTPKKSGGKDGDPPSSRRGKKKKKEEAFASSLAPIAEGPKAGSALLLCATSPLMEAAGSKGLALRAEADLTSDKAGELPSGSTVHVVETRPTADGAIRMAVVPEGTTAVIGWLTGITKDGKKNLNDIGRPVMEVVAAKALAAREAFELTSGKAGELPVGAFVHLLEARETADGASRVAFAPEGTETVKGWVTAITKDGVENFALAKGRRAPAAAAGGAAGQVRGAATRRASSGPRMDMHICTCTYHACTRAHTHVHPFV